MQLAGGSYVPLHLTRHTSHVTRHTSHVTHQLLVGCHTDDLSHALAGAEQVYWLRPWGVTQSIEVRPPGVTLQVKYGGLVFLSSCAPVASSPSHTSPCIVARITGVTPAPHCCPLLPPPALSHDPPNPPPPICIEGLAPWGDFTCSSSSSSSSGGIVFTMSRDILQSNSTSLEQAAVFWDKIVRGVLS